MQKSGVFWKVQDICYNMGTEIFKIEEEMTQKMKPKVANPLSKNGQNSLLLLSLQVMKMQRDIKGVHIVSSEFCRFFGGGLATLGFIFSVISSSILKISVPIM